ncbi:hypothetical protein CCP3SC1AL1_610004 [Gammaproteobacteria bacterium]
MQEVEVSVEGGVVEQSTEATPLQQ